MVVTCGLGLAGREIGVGDKVGEGGGGVILEGMIKRECGAGSGTLCAWSFLRASFGSFG